MLNGSRVRRSMQASVMRLSAPMAHTLSPGAWAAWAWSSRGGSFERGAGRLVLNGRTEPSDGQQSDLADLANSAEIVFVPGDIASPGVAERLVAAAEETGRPLRGVVHAAGVSADGRGGGCSPGKVWNGCGRPRWPAPCGCTQRRPTRQLDWWVGFSSMASLLGLPGQMAYASANAWLDALVAWRRASGLPATTINWGQWSDVGMSRSLTYSVLDPITPGEGIEALESLVGGNLTRVGVARLRLDRAVAATPEFRELGYFERVLGEFDTVERRRTDRSLTIGDRSVAPVRDWSQIPAEDRLSKLVISSEPSWPANFACRHQQSTWISRSPSWDSTR